MTTHQLLETGISLSRLGVCVSLFGLFIFALGLVYGTIGTMRKNEAEKAKAGLVFYWDARKHIEEARLKYMVGKTESGRMVYYPAPPNGVKFVPDENGTLRAVPLPAPTD